MLAFQNGDDSAFESLFLRYKDRVFHFLFRYFHDADLAMEWTQETFLRVYQSRVDYRPRAAFSTWIFTIATQLALNERRRRNRWQELASPRSADEPTGPELPGPANEVPDAAFERLSAVDAVARAIQELPETQRVLVLLTYYHDLSVVEAARITGCTPLGGRLRLLRARRFLRKRLERYTEPEGKTFSSPSDSMEE